jgi:hypothetical protein
LLQSTTNPRQGRSSGVRIAVTQWVIMANNFNSNLNRAIKIFFNVETIVPFLIGSFCLGIFSNALYDTLKKTIGEDTFSLLKIGGSSLLIFTLAAIVFTLRLNQATQAKLDPLLATKDNPSQYKGLILLVSRQQPCQIAIEFHLPELKQCWLICSLKTLPEAQALRAEYGDKIIIDEPIVIEDVYDPLEYAKRIDLIYTKKLPKDWQESDIIADFAGMTANGSVGMALLCYAKNRPLQYTPAVVDKATGNITGSANPIEIKLQ